MGFYIGKMLLEYCLNVFLRLMQQKIMHDLHEGECGGHIYWKNIANKILRFHYYWPTLFPDTQKLVMSCHRCQIIDGKIKLLHLPLHPILLRLPFNNGVLTSMGKFTHIFQPNISGSSLPLIILPSG